MFTLKIKWERYEATKLGDPSRLADEAELFLLAERVEAHGRFEGEDWREGMKAWEAGTYMQYVTHSVHDDGTHFWHPSRLIHVIHRDGDGWYLASSAYVMLDGKTIERIAP